MGRNATPNEDRMSLNDTELARAEHPVDIVEQIAALHQWRFERSAEDEISISIAGGWTDYEAGFTWLEDLEALHFGCAFDLRVPEGRRAEVLKLISLINEQLWVGHFDLWQSENVVMFRHSMLLSGTRDASPNACESLMKLALKACDRYYQAFQFTVWAGKTARESLDSAMFETVGRA